MSDVPYFRETRVRQALVRVHEAARLKGLLHAFDVELFAAGRAVRDLLGAPKVGGEPRKACDAPVGRAGRRAFGRR